MAAAVETREAIFAPAATMGGRFAAAGKFLLFLVVAIILVGIISVGLLYALHIPRPSAKDAGAMHDPRLLLLNEVGLAGGAILATLALAAAFKEPLGRFGFGFRATPRLRELGLGAAAGFAMLTLLLGAIAVLGGFSFGHVTDTPMQMLQFGSLYALLFALVALAEEFMMRGYAMVQLSRAVSFWPAALIMSALFGLIHATNAGETPLGLFSAGAIGFVFAYSFYRSGSLMWALGFHAAWDYAQSFVWGVPDSGTNLPGALFTPSIHGAEWLTGGAVGPEGSWLIVPIILIAGVAAHVMLRPQRGLLRR